MFQGGIFCSRESMKKIFFLLIIFLASNFAAVSAQSSIIEEKDGTLRFNRLSQVFNARADYALSNTWFNNRSGDDEYKLIGDYRAEFETSLLKLNGGQDYEQTGTLVARTEGFVILDEDVNFFEDKLIDLPELFYKHEIELPRNNQAFVYAGKFTNRRFLDKDEISPDNFDIGERFHYSSLLDTGTGSTLGSILNTNSLINVMNYVRGLDRPGAPSTGSYGIGFGIKDMDGNGFWDRWGFRQMFATLKMERFADTAFTATEINKNWGYRNPGQMNFGFIHGNAEAFQIFDDDNGYLFYGSLVQKYKDFTPYMRWGTFNSSFDNRDFTINMITTGLFWQLGVKDMLGAHWVLFDSYFDDDTDHILRNVYALTWKHWFNQYLSSVAFLEFNQDQPKVVPGPRRLLDNNWNIGFTIQGQI